jgi:hypothetical protein
VAALADSLSESLETRVAVELGRRRGKIVIEFGSLDDLERIAGLLGVDARVASAEAESPDAHSGGASPDGDPGVGEHAGDEGHHEGRQGEGHQSEAHHQEWDHDHGE